MDRKLSLASNFKRLRADDHNLVLFTTGVESIEIINLETSKRTSFNTGMPVLDVKLFKDRFRIVSESKSKEFRITDYRRVSTVVFTEMAGLCSIRKPKTSEDRYTMIVYTGNYVIYQTTKNFIEKERYLYIQSMDQYLLIVFENRIDIYEDKNGLIRSIPIDDFEKRFHPIFSLSEGKVRKLKDVYFSIHNQKIYVMVDNRVVGHDLNFYMEDFYSLVPLDTSTAIHRFQCISGQLIFYDDKNRLLFIVPKNSERIDFQIECSDFAYRSKSNALFIVNETALESYVPICRCTLPFTLIDQNVIFEEAEDEFDVSDSSYKDFE